MKGDALLKTMLSPDFYPHQVETVELVETHISWVFLAGKYAYKVKKPVDLGFLDFSTLPKRHYFCTEELRLNRRFAPDLYLDVIPIGLVAGKPVLGGIPAVEYAVKMKRFAAGARLDRVLMRDSLRGPDMEQAAELIANFHAKAEVASGSCKFGGLRSIASPALMNFRQIYSLCENSVLQEQARQLECWTRRSCRERLAAFRLRKEHGWIRECHGDLHLENMVLLDQGPQLFDCIEFSEQLRWIDVINDVAFLLMDLDDRGRPDLGWWFFNRYLQITGDYPGLSLLPFYKVYRAMVRAKIHFMRLQQLPTGDSRKACLEMAAGYLRLAQTYTGECKRLLIITHGFSGSGKSTLLRQLAPLCGFLTLSSDLERKRLYGLAAEQRSGDGIDQGIYSAEATAKTYGRLRELAGIALHAGFAVSVDATFASRAARRQLLDLASSCQVPTVILDFKLSQALLEERLRGRTEGVSEADVRVLERQLKRDESVGDNEADTVIEVGAEVYLDVLGARLKNCFR